MLLPIRWKTSSGEVIFIRDMETSHLQNTVLFIEKRLRTDKSLFKYLNSCKQAMINELKIRMYNDLLGEENADE